MKTDSPASVEAAAVWVDRKSLVPWGKNPRKNDAAVKKVVESIKRFGFASPIIARRENNEVIAGHTRLKAAEVLGLDRVPVRYLDLDPAEAHLLALADNKLNEVAEWIPADVASILSEYSLEDAELAGFDSKELDALASELGAEDPLKDTTDGASLSDRFIVPPFSVLDARQGYWQDRKRAWIATGLKSERGRDATTFHNKTLPDGIGDGISEQSIFDPVLCELAYAWFCPPSGRILDPFAGGSVRGIVAASLGREYVGVDIRAEQVSENEAQWGGMADALADKPPPSWVTGDSVGIEALVSGRFDFVFSCPPYADLEVYSDNPRDISNMDYPAFMAAYRKIIAASVRTLSPDRFACFVVGDIRDKKGFYRNFVSDTIRAFEDGGARLYNEAAVVSPVGTLAARAGRQFSATRKLGKAHQNVLVFCKGDPKKATAACGDVEVWTPPEGEA